VPVAADQPAARPSLRLATPLGDWLPGTDVQRLAGPGPPLAQVPAGLGVLVVVAAGAQAQALLHAGGARTDPSPHRRGCLTSSGRRATGDPARAVAIGKLVDLGGDPVPGILYF